MDNELRAAIVCLHGAPPKLRGTLRQEWAGCTPAQAYDKLASSDVSVTNMSDKEVQLPKILALETQVRALGLTRSWDHQRDSTPSSAPLDDDDDATMALRVGLRTLTGELAAADLTLRQQEEQIALGEGREAAAQDHLKQAMHSIVEMKAQIMEQQRKIAALEGAKLDLQQALQDAANEDGNRAHARSLTTASTGSKNGSRQLSRNPTRTKARAAGKERSRSVDHGQTALGMLAAADMPPTRRSSSTSSLGKTLQPARALLALWARSSKRNGTELQTVAV